MICGNILSPTNHVNVAFSCNLLYTNSFTLIILCIIYKINLFSMSLWSKSLLESLCKVFQCKVFAVNDPLSQERSWSHTRCAIFQILSILCLTLFCPNSKLKFWVLLVTNGSLEISSHSPAWILWRSFWISWCDLDDFSLKQQHSIQQSHCHCIVQHGLINFHCWHDVILLYHIKPTNGHQHHQIKEWRSQILHHTRHLCCLGSCLTLWWLVKNPILSCEMSWCIQLAHGSICCIVLLSKAKGTWCWMHWLLAMSSPFLKCCFWFQLLDKLWSFCWNHWQNYSKDFWPYLNN